MAQLKGKNLQIQKQRAKLDESKDQNQVDRGGLLHGTTKRKVKTALEVPS